MKSNRTMALGVAVLAVVGGGGMMGSATAVWGQSATLPGGNQGVVQQQAGSAENPAPVENEKSMDQLIEEYKHPFKGFSWGADQRLRQEYFNNFITLNGNAPNHEYDFSRNRTRLWASYAPAEFIEFNGRLIWEWRYYIEPTNRPEWAWNQAEFDTFNFKIKMPQINSYLTVGRQDIVLGDGWLVLEGTPLDGSTTMFFDAARFNIDLKDYQTKVDAIYINQYSNIDEWLPTMGTTNQAVIEQNERGAILYASNKTIKDTTVDGYFIYKHDEKVLANGNNDDMYVFGSRGEHLFSPHIKGRAEGAYEFGDKNGNALSAFGVTARGTYMFKDTFDQQVFFAGEFLSGRQANSSTDTQFDPMWGRWPQFSEGYVYTDISETRVAETTNLIRFGPGYELHPTKKMTILSSYNAMFADTTPFANTANYGPGNFRGNLFTAVMKYKFNTHVSGHLWSEFFLPGDYYSAARDDLAIYLRAELMFTF